jgi:hypothetical protein
MAAGGKEVLMRTRFVLLVLVLAALPLACGGGETSPEAAVAEAATKTEEAGSARVTFAGTLTGVPGGSFTMNGEGEFAKKRGRMTFDLSEAGVPGGSMEMIFDGLVIYMKFPPELAAVLPGGKSWVKMDLEELGKQQGIDFGELMQFSQSDPTQSLQYLRGASDDFEKVGEEAVRGVETTHYRGTIDLRKAAEALPDSARKSFDRVIELTGASKIPFDVWIDDEGLARRVNYDQALPTSNGQEASMALTMEFFDFGVEVDVESPPENEVVDLQELIAGESS